MGNMGSMWIQEAIKRPGSLRAWMKKKYGSKAFTKDGKIKKEYLLKAKKYVMKNYRGRAKKVMLGKINLALTLRKFKK